MCCGVGQSEKTKSHVTLRWNDMLFRETSDLIPAATGAEYNLWLWKEKIKVKPTVGIHRQGKHEFTGWRKIQAGTN